MNVFIDEKLNMYKKEGEILSLLPVNLSELFSMRFNHLNLTIQKQEKTIDQLAMANRRLEDELSICKSDIREIQNILRRRG